MMNWRIMRTSSMIALGVGAGISLGFGGILGISNVADKIGPFTWLQIIGAFQIYALYVIKNITRA